MPTSVTHWPLYSSYAFAHLAVHVGLYRDTTCVWNPGIQTISRHAIIILLYLLLMPDIIGMFYFWFLVCHVCRNLSMTICHQLSHLNLVVLQAFQLPLQRFKLHSIWIFNLCGLLRNKKNHTINAMCTENMAVFTLEAHIRIMCPETCVLMRPDTLCVSSVKTADWKYLS